MFNTFRRIFLSLVFFKHKQVKISAEKKKPGFLFEIRSNESLKVPDINQLFVNQQGVIEKFQWDLCDASYVGYTLTQHQRVDEHTKQSSHIGKHFD